MINKEILHADMLDILFEHRNKAYGAYALRRTYPQRLLLALASGLALAATICLIKTSPTGYDNGITAKGPVVTVTEINLPDKKLKLPDQPKPKPKMQVADESYTSQISIVDDYIKTKMPDMASIDASMTESKNDAGSSENPGQVSGNGGDTSNETSKKEEGATFVPRQADATFPGGSDALARFLKRNIVIPEDLESGEKKIVLVRFIVDTDGTIAKTEIVQSDGQKYSDEVLRILHKMPKWKPAMQNGINVATWFSQTITFIRIEQ